MIANRICAPFRSTAAALLLCLSSASFAADAPTAEAARPRPYFSGVYPHLAMFNNEGECGTGAVVPWAGKLWVITYGPHLPKGSSDKLYEIDPQLNQTIRPESIGGTPANRMIHPESQQLFIGPYAIDKDGKVRVIPYSEMFGRHTANARHLTDPAGKIYYTTMEEGVYEVDVKTLAVTELFPDGNKNKGDHGGQLLPGYHGKGSYSGQGVLVYANNGETSAEAKKRPDVPSGVLAEWNGKDWTVIRRNQFTEVTGPGGIEGSKNPATDPIWSIGWDHRSLMLMLRDGGKWHMFRLPKGSHSYDGAHGWNTEWPRIREIGEGDLLMTMHGTFWRFPRTFAAGKAAGIRPRSNYLRVIGDFARWGDRVVFGCDDTAKSEFLNKRKAKGNLIGPGQSQSNLWFTAPDAPDTFGPAIGRGAVWVNEKVTAGQWSDPYLFAGYDRRGVHIVVPDAKEPVGFHIQIDADGTGDWADAEVIMVPPGGRWVPFGDDQKGEWVRVRAQRDLDRATVQFIYSNADPRTSEAPPLFNGIAKADTDGPIMAGLVRARGENLGTLMMAAMNVTGERTEDVGYYELDAAMKLRRGDDPKALDYAKKNVAIPEGVLSIDDASVLYVDDAGKRWRLPRGDAAFDALTGKGLLRIDREVCTERDLFNAHGTFYELPAENAGGFAKVRPVATHNRRVMDYCTFRGLLVLTGIAGGDGNAHIIRSDDGKAAVWAGVVDDLWKLGKPRGHGGPWKDSAVKANEPSDAYLMTAYDAKRLALSHDATEALNLRVEVDVTGDGHWATYRTFDVPAGEKVEHAFPAGFQAYWVRTVADRDCRATAQLVYE